MGGSSAAFLSFRKSAESSRTVSQPFYINSLPLANYSKTAIIEILTAKKKRDPHVQGGHKSAKALNASA
jgi:hypothetical protein